MKIINFILFGVIVSQSLFAQNINRLLCNANSLYDQKQFKKAIVLYKQLLDKYPSNLIVQYNLGNSCFRDKNYNEAINAFEKSSKSLDNHIASQSFYNLGVALVRRNRLEDALYNFKKAVLLNNEDRRAKDNLQLVSNWLSARSQSNNNTKDQNAKSTNSGKSKDASSNQSEAAKLLTEIQKKENKMILSNRLKSQKFSKKRLDKDW